MLPTDAEVPPDLGEMVSSPPPDGPNEIGADRPVLFHYTDQAGLKGIIESQELWATRAIFLNDSSEIMEAFRASASTCEERLGWSDSDLRQAGLSEPDVVRAGLRAFIRYVEEVGHPDPAMYIVSMSESGDMLSQWRGYGNHSVALDWHSLDALQGWRLVKCRYSRAEQAYLVNAAVETSLWEVQRLLQAGSPTSPDQIRGIIHSCVMQIAPAIKNSAFHEEREWRLVNPLTDPFPTPEMRPSARSLVQYTRIPLLDGTVKGVIVGPGPYQTVTMAGASALADTAKVKGWTVTHSAIPYLP